MKHFWNTGIIIKVMLILLHYKGSPTESTKKISVLAGKEATLKCLFNKMAKPDNLHLSSIIVEWNMVDKHSKKQLVYMFEDETAKVNREGSLVDRMGLLQHNASLRLPNVSVGDEGLYTCTVIITPNSYTENMQLEVSARPSVSLPDTAMVKGGEEKTLRCDITGFYPQKLDVTWLIQNGSHSVPETASRLSRVCTGMAVRNTDGTYNVSSGITIQVAAVKNREVQVICQITHRSYLGSYNKSLTLTALAPKEQNYNAGILIAVTSAISILLVFAVIGGVLVTYRHFHTIPPSVSEIITPTIIYAKIPTDLKCTIRRIKQRELKVKWFKITANRDFTPAAIRDQRSETDPMLANEDLSDQATIHSESTHHVSILTVCLSISEDQTTYQCVVLHRGREITKTTTVHLKVEPSFLQISSIPQIPKVERLLVLCCRVEKFYPEETQLEWSRNDGEQVKTVCNFGPFSDHEGLYSMWSKIELTMAKEDERAVFTCRVYHSSFPEPRYKDVLYHINTQGTPPTVKFINCEPQIPVLGEDCILNLCIKDFCSKHVNVVWFKNGQEVHYSVFNTPPSLNVNGLYSMWSFLKLTVTREDCESEFRCQVSHSAQREPEERVFTLSDLVIAVNGQRG